MSNVNIVNYINSNNRLSLLFKNLSLNPDTIISNIENKITFLAPDDKLTGELEKLANKENKYEATKFVQSLFLTIYLPSVDFFKKVKDDIPTLLGKKIPEVVEEKSSTNKIQLKNGSILELLSISNNKSIWKLSNKLIPYSGETSSNKYANHSASNVTGGIEYEVNRGKLFENILKKYTIEDSKTDNTPMEVLVMMCKWAVEEKKDHNMCNSICSQLSLDTITTLAIVLQPYKTSGYTYITDEELSEFCAWASNESGGSENTSYLSSGITNMVDEYKKHMNNEEVKKLVPNVVSTRQKAIRVNTKYVIIENIYNHQKDISKNMDNMERRQKSYDGDLKEGEFKNSLGLCETELRVVGALMYENEIEKDYNKLLGVFKKYNLSEVWILSTVEMVDCNIACYYSTAYLALRSDAFLYLPGIPGSSLDNVANEKHYIKLDSGMVIPDKKTSKLGGLIKNSMLD